MGLLDGLIAGVGAAAGAGAQYFGNVAMTRLKAEADLAKEKAIAEFRRDMDEGTQIRKEGRARDARREDAEQINEQAGLIAARRNVIDPEVDAQADAAAAQYNKLLSEGKITQEEANAAYAAAGEFRNSQLESNTATPTTSDYMRARAEINPDAWKDVAVMEGKDASIETRQRIAELQQSTAFAKMDAQTQIALAKLDAAIAKGASSGTPPTQVQQIEYLIANGMTRDQATNLVYHPEGKIGEYDTVETEQLTDKGTVKTTTKRKAGSKPIPEKGNRPPLESFSSLRGGRQWEGK